MTIDRDDIDDGFAGGDVEDVGTFFDSEPTFPLLSWDLRGERESACDDEQEKCGETGIAVVRANHGTLHKALRAGHRD
jgi:hypothetical protein